MGIYKPDKYARKIEKNFRAHKNSRSCVREAAKYECVKTGIIYLLPSGIPYCPQT